MNGKPCKWYYCIQEFHLPGWFLPFSKITNTKDLCILLCLFHILNRYDWNGRRFQSRFGCSGRWSSQECIELSVPIDAIDLSINWSIGRTIIWSSCLYQRAGMDLCFSYRIHVIVSRWRGNVSSERLFQGVGGTDPNTRRSNLTNCKWCMSIFICRFENNLNWVVRLKLISMRPNRQLLIYLAVSLKSKKRQPIPKN